MTEPQGSDSLAIGLFSEIATVDQLMKARLAKALPRGMELSHFTVLNYFAQVRAERTPAQLARVLHVTKGAMTNTLRKLEEAGFVHIRPDWDDGRRKLVTISRAGLLARDRAVESVTPVLEETISLLSADDARTALPILRKLRTLLAAGF